MVGDTVDANDANNDRLTYSLEAEIVDADTPTDADVFQIDRKTGQLTVGLGNTVSPVSDTGETGVPGIQLAPNPDNELHCHHQGHRPVGVVRHGRYDDHGG